MDGRGLRPDPERLRAIAGFPRPENRTDLRAFFGLAEQLASFSKDKARHLGPLRFLLQKGQPWTWSRDCQEAFEATHPTQLTIRSETVTGRVFQGHDAQVDDANGFRYTPTEITLGQRAGNVYIVLDGLSWFCGAIRCQGKE